MALVAIACKAGTGLLSSYVTENTGLEDADKEVRAAWCVENMRFAWNGEETYWVQFSDAVAQVYVLQESGSYAVQDLA